MLIVYMSLTGQTRKFVKKLGFAALEINATNPFQEVHEPFIVIAPTYELEVTDILNDFIEAGNNRAFLKGVAGGGNRNFNTLFGFTAKDLARDYSVPLLHLFEFQGDKHDVKDLVQNIHNLEISCSSERKTIRDKGI